MVPPHLPTFAETIDHLTSMMSSLKIMDGTRRQLPADQLNAIASNPPSTNTNTSNIKILPNELLMKIFGYLAFDDVQPNLDRVAFKQYKQAQNDLRHVCLVSRKMDAVARQYLYRGVVVTNANVLALFLRAVDSNPSNGQYVKRLVFEVPLDLEDVRYQRPNVAVLGSHPSLSRICAFAAECSDYAAYTKAMAARRQAAVRFPFPIEEETFTQWTREEERDIFSLMLSEILDRTSNLDFLACDLISSNELRVGIRYSGILRRLSLPFRELGKLRDFQMVGGKKDGGVEHFKAYVMDPLFNVPSLRSLKCLRDDGGWYHIGPHSSRLRDLDIRLSRGQYSNLRHLDLRRSKCSMAAIFHICDTFPSLEYLSISIERGTPAKSRFARGIDGFGTTNLLSDRLAKLEHLTDLALDFRHKHDVKALLGVHGILNLTGLNKLTNVRLPLHFLVEAQAGNEPFVPELSVLLPRSVEHLTVWANMDSVRVWGVKPFSPSGPPPAPALPYHPGRLAVDFMDAVHGLLAGHLNQLKNVAYYFGDPVMDTACQCDADTMCSRCEALQLLDVQAAGDSATRMGMLASNFEARGVCLRVMKEQIEE